MLTMNKSSLLLPVLLGGLHLSPRKPSGTQTGDHPAPPPTPRPRRKTEEDRFSRRRQALALPSGHQEGDDDDEEKENQPPVRDEEEENVISSLLKKLEEAIDQFHEQVYQELKDLKRKLGIRQ
ncbi:E4 [Human papillomavirus 202]|uniref:E4 n=1 Tax=Human papillomavirus 202 TaxID=1682341 RepID=A0A0H4LQW4_9PAPI|nr:E4 [Human papillomavirus 202]